MYYSGEATAIRNNSKPQCLRTERFPSHSCHPSHAGPLLPLLDLMVPTPHRASWEGSPPLWGWLAHKRSVGLRRALLGQAWRGWTSLPHLIFQNSVLKGHSQLQGRQPMWLFSEWSQQKWFVTIWPALSQMPDFSSLPSVCWVLGALLRDIHFLLLPEGTLIIVWAPELLCWET